MADARIDKSVVITVTLTPEEVGTIHKSLRESEWIGQAHEDLREFFGGIEEDCR